jgi:peptide/nickel transport system permease protein
MPFCKHFCLSLGRIAAIVAAVAVLSFVLVSHSPIDPIDAYMGTRILTISPEHRAQIASNWGLDRPAPERMATWASNLVRGDFGWSTIYNEPVMDVIAKRFAASLWLMAGAWILSGVIGFVLGIVAGMYPGSPLDRCIRIYALTLASTPTFWIGLLLLVIFSVGLGWAPVCCAAPPGIAVSDVTLLQRLHHLALPALTLSIVGVAQIAMHTREKMIEIRHSDYALFARAMGESNWGFVRHHALRGVALPAITLQFASLGELFGGSILAEQVFSYPGLGQATVEAGLRGDIPLLLGIVIFSTVFVCVGNLMADVLYWIVDPRIKATEQS